MDTEIDELLEDEYAAQQEETPHIHPVEINGENEKKTAIEVGTLLVDISETLRLLSEQIVLLDATTKSLPETVAALKTTTEAVRYIGNELPVMVREQCLEEYKKILANAVENYNQMQKEAVKWHKSLGKEREGRFQIITISAIITPIFLLLHLL
jgi:hypothetical protein